ncbi:helix-turn-helix transcriptional regulator [Mycobacterium sp. AZCC_0083]|uniref:helix-turn-helix domain-containing protein n=1 Tax=Mycobacterium sp. AZCC_0083 TaxID=2735882 RepID=UPI00185AD2BF|nr:helix-turn-helix transcriptional regulator [Mycobacterium sp. AZCC_0083]MBB5167587.1 transcriptional regulator with XRE-family HTH domain [Mycobacterium sp. AZCC_0083]
MNRSNAAAVDFPAGLHRHIEVDAIEYRRDARAPGACAVEWKGDGMLDPRGGQPLGRRAQRLPRGNAVGEYLKARRNAVRPEDVGLPLGARRRVPGLRREELATLAGISSHYYLRIEQGRNDNPSPRVLDALAKALRLDAAATAHLHELARRKYRQHSAPERVGEGIVTLVDQLTIPAFVAGRYLDVLAANELARALSPTFTIGHNLLYQLFLDPAEHRLHVDWDAATAGVVGGLRQGAGSDPEDPRLTAIVNQLSTESERFRILWSRADVGFRPAGSSHLRHPQVGQLILRRNRFSIPDSPGQYLQTYHAEPGTESADKLTALQR